MAKHDTSARIGRGLRVALILSLALNLLVLGLVAGFLLRGDPLRPDLTDRRDLVAPYARALTDDQRIELRRSLRRAMAADGAPSGDLAADYRAALAALRAEPFDRVAFAAVLSRQAERAAGRRGRGQDALASYLAALPPEARAVYADRLEAELDQLARRWPVWRRQGP